ncbi:MAG: 50S ribosomal protein L9 [Bacteroidia bacterium]|nr:50S ribosomal protein L9 [Bacteroidia bacterium]
MDIILLKDIDKVGYKHEVVSVKPGYGRNYLIPQGKALLANASNMKRLAEFKKREERSEMAKLDLYKDLVEKIGSQTLKIGAKAGKEGKIFGSVTNVQISSALKEQLDVDVERRKIQMPEEVKFIGSYEATLNLHPEVVTNVAFEVVEE